MYSMTGFGRGTASSEAGTVTVELKSVNSRFLEINVRNSYFSGALEEAARQAVKKYIHRGKISMSLSFTPSAQGTDYTVHVDEKLLSSYMEALKEVQKQKGMKKGKISISDLLALPQPFLSVTKSDISDEELSPLLSEALGQALQGLLDMRYKEGENLKADLSKRIQFLRGKLAFLVSKQDVAAREYEARLRDRLTKTLSAMGFDIDEGRILEEVALYSEKTDYTEEVVRFASHLDQFSHLLEAEEPVGRKLDFLLQEINREVNTTSSKASDTEVVDCVIIIKTELEKVREQVQNIE